MPYCDRGNNRSLQARLRDEDGQGLVELGLVLGLIAVVSIIALTSVGFAVADSFDSFASAFGNDESGSSTAATPPEDAYDPPEDANGPPNHSGGPPDPAPGPPDHAGGPPNHAGGPPDTAPGPPNHAPGPPVATP